MYGTSETPISRFFLRVTLRLLGRRVGTYLYLDVSQETCISNFRVAGRTSFRFNADTPEVALAEFRADRTYADIISGLMSVAPGKLRLVASASEAREALAR